MTTRKPKRKPRRMFEPGEHMRADQLIDHGTIRPFPISSGHPSLAALVQEVDQMTEVLLGHDEPPVNLGVQTMLEVADAYFARGQQMMINLRRAERDGTVKKNSPHYYFRTGELREFLILAKRCAETGSRRLTYAALRFEMTKTGKESAGPIDHGWDTEEDEERFEDGA